MTDYIVPAIEPPLNDVGNPYIPNAVPMQSKKSIDDFIPGFNDDIKVVGKNNSRNSASIEDFIPGFNDDIKPKSKSVAQITSILQAMDTAKQQSEWDDNSPVQSLSSEPVQPQEEHTHDSMMQKMQNPEYWQSLDMSFQNGLGHIGGAVAQALLHSGVDVPAEWKKAVDQAIAKNDIKDEALRAKVGRSGMNIPKIAGESAPLIAAAIASGGTAIPSELGILGLVRTGAIAGAQNAAITPEENSPVDNAEFWKRKAWNMLKGGGAGAVAGPVAGKVVPVAGKLANDLSGGSLGAAAQAVAPKSIADVIGAASTPTAEEAVTNSAIKLFINNLHRISPTAGSMARIADALGLLGSKSAPTAASALKNQAQVASAKAGGIAASGSEAKEARGKAYKKASELINGMKEKNAKQD